MRTYLTQFNTIFPVRIKSIWIDICKCKEVVALSVT